MSWWHKWWFYKSMLFRRLRREFATCGLCQLSSSIQTRWSLSTRLEDSHSLGTPHSNRFGRIPTWMHQDATLELRVRTVKYFKDMWQVENFPEEPSFKKHFKVKSKVFFLNRCMLIWTSWATMRWGSWVSDPKLTKLNFSKLQRERQFRWRISK